MDDYRRKEKINENSDIYKGLTPAEKISAKRYYHVMIRGKLARGVPILIDESLAPSIDKLIELRQVAGVGTENEYLFAKGDMGRFDASHALTEAAYDCGAKEPKMLTSSRLRKHIASVAQSLNMNESEIQTLSAYMGHTAQTHIEHYRVPSLEMHTAKISKLLLALDAGTISKYRGKRIEDIEVDMSIDAMDEEIQGEAHDITKPSTSSTTAKEQTSSKQTPKKKRQNPIHNTPKKSPFKKINITSPSPAKGKVRWTVEEQEIMRREFKEKIESGKLPTPEECHKVRGQFEALQKRRVVIMKAWVFNEIKRVKKHQEEKENPREKKKGSKRKRRSSFVVSDTSDSDS